MTDFIESEYQYVSGEAVSHDGLIWRSTQTGRFVSKPRAYGVVFHPTDWEEIKLTRNDQGEYVW